MYCRVYDFISVNNILFNTQKHTTYMAFLGLTDQVSN